MAVTGGTGATPGNPPTSGETGNSWPQMGYDSNNTYFNPKETKLSVANAPMLKEKWRFSTSGNPPGTPTIGEGKVFVMSTGGTYGINLADGSKAWERTDIVGTATVTYDAGFVYVHAFEGPNLYKLKASDGTNVWGPVKTNPNGMCDGMSSPIVGAGVVVVGHSCGQLEVGSDVSNTRGGAEAFDLATGMQKWVYFTVPATGEDGAMVWSSVAIDADSKVVFAATGNNYSMQGENSDSIHAIDLGTGMRKWKTQVHNNDTWSLLFATGGPDTDFGANPILGVVGGKKVVADGDKGSSFFMFDRETGAVIWKRDQLSSSRNAQNGGVLMNGAFDGTYFYVVSNQPPNAAVLHAMDPMKEGADAWPAKTFMKTTWGAPSIANGVLVVPNDDDLYVLNAKTGEQLAMFNTGGTIAAGAAAIVDGNIVVPSGLSYYLDPSTKNNNQIICYAVPGAGTGAAPTAGAAAGGTGGTGGAGGMGAPAFTPGSPTFSAIFEEIIVGTGCNGGPTCHSGTQAGMLKMSNKADTYTALVGVKAMGRNLGTGGGTNCADTQLVRVVPNDPANSLLLQKVEAAMPACGMHMPIGGNLKPEQIEQIRMWIAGGAKND